MTTLLKNYLSVKLVGEVQQIFVLENLVGVSLWHGTIILPCNPSVFSSVQGEYSTLLGGLNYLTHIECLEHYT